MAAGGVVARVGGRVLDVGDAGCGAAVEIARALEGLAAGEVLEVVSTDRAMEGEIGAWARMCGHEVLGCELEGRVVRCRVRKGRA